MLHLFDYNTTEIFTTLIIWNSLKTCGDAKLLKNSSNCCNSYCKYLSQNWGMYLFKSYWAFVAEGTDPRKDSKKVSIYLFHRIKARRFLFYCSFQRDSISCRCFNGIKTAWLWTNILPIFPFNSHFLQISGTAEICHHLDHSCKEKKKKQPKPIKTFLQYILI